MQMHHKKKLSCTYELCAPLQIFWSIIIQRKYWRLL